MQHSNPDFEKCHREFQTVDGFFFRLLSGIIMRRRSGGHLMRDFRGNRGIFARNGPRLRAMLVYGRREIKIVINLN
jgi:hypothetical protein